MKKNVILMALTVLAITLCSCHGVQVNAGRSRQVSKKLAVTGFNRIQEEGSMDVVYTQDSVWSVRIVGPKELIQGAYASVSKDGTLILSEHEQRHLNINFFSYDRGLTAYVSSPDLLGVSLQGSGDFFARGKVDTDNLNVGLDGSGDASFEEVICDRCLARLSGSGDLKMNRLTTSGLSVECEGSGDTSLGKISAVNTAVSAEGSGDVTLHFVKGDMVNVRSEGSGDVMVKGSFGRLIQQKNGSGDIYVGKH